MRLLSEVESAPETTQRTLATKLRISLGLTNLLLRNLARKGYVRVVRAGWRRRLYALTPVGFSRKFQLTVTYVHRYLDHYRWVRQTLQEELRPLGLNMESRVALYGTGEFAELVYLAIKALGIEEVDVFASGSPDSTRFLGLSVQDITTLQPEHYDRVLVAILDDLESHRAELIAVGISPKKMVTLFSAPSPENTEAEEE